MRSWLFAVLLALLVTRPLAAQSPAPRRLTLEQAIARARQVAPDLAAELATLEQRRLELRGARDAYLPTAALSASETLAHARRNDGVSTGSLTDLSAAGSADINATLLDFGRRSSVVSAARYGLEVQRQAKRSAERDAGVRAAALFLQILADDERSAARASNLAEQQKTLDAIRLLVSKGFRAAVDEIRAQADLVRADLDYKLAREQAEGDHRSLSILLGYPLDAAPELVAVDDSMLVLDLAPERVLHDATRGDPEIAAARARAQQADASAAAARAEVFPVFGLTAGANLVRSDALGTLSPTSLRFTPALTTTNLQVGASLRWSGLDATVWDRAAAAEAAARAELQRVPFQVRERQLLVLETAQAARAAVLGLERAEQVLALAAHSAELEVERYRAGQASLLELLDAQRLFHDARIERIDARLARDISIVRLRLLTGVDAKF